MRILLLTDIHANLEGLEACLEAVRNPDLVVNLGDIVGYGGSPNEVSERSREIGSIFVRGNHDKACTGVSGIEEFNPIAGMAALWTRQQLTPENLEWLRALPQGPVQLESIWPADGGPLPVPEARDCTKAVAEGGSEAGAKEVSEAAIQVADQNTASQAGFNQLKVQCVHGSPLDEDEYIIVMRDAYEPLMHTDAAITFFGHTHIQGGFCNHGQDWETLRPVYHSKKQTEWCELWVAPGTKYLINPGSVGQPRDGDWRAACALFDTKANSVTFYRVPYDVEGAQRRILEAKLPERLANRLSEGR